MKLYKCNMQDEFMEEPEECIIAVCDNECEQEAYFQLQHKAKTDFRIKALKDSGYFDITEDDIEFWFPCYCNGIYYAHEIAENRWQTECDTDYWDFRYVEPNNTPNKKNQSSIGAGVDGEVEE